MKNKDTLSAKLNKREILPQIKDYQMGYLYRKKKKMAEI